jgi:hypothetical protein
MAALCNPRHEILAAPQPGQPRIYVRSRKFEVGWIVYLRPGEATCRGNVNTQSPVDETLHGNVEEHVHKSFVNHPLYLGKQVRCNLFRELREADVRPAVVFARYVLAMLRMRRLQAITFIVSSRHSGSTTIDTGPGDAAALLRMPG